MGAARDNLGQARFDELRGRIPGWIPSPDALACATQAGRDASLALGYDCNHWSNFNADVNDGFGADSSDDQIAAAAAAAAAQDAFNANFDAAWNAYMTAINTPRILRDEQGTPLEPEGPATVQGYPQRIPKPPGMQQKALPENEPQRVYNQDDSSEEPQLAIGESESPGLPLMTIGTVAIGGVLIFLWVRRDG